MTATSSTITFDTTSDTTFRAWVSTIVNAIQAGGLSRTSDTGQIDVTTVTKPGANNTVAGYAMYQLGVGGVYAKMEFGRGNGTNNSFFALQLGAATNGAGTLSGNVSTRRTYDYGILSAQQFRAVGLADCFAFGHINASGTNNETLMGAEPWRNADGTAATGGAWQFDGNEQFSNSWVGETIAKTGFLGHGVQTVTAQLPAFTATLMVGASIPLYTINPVYNGILNPSRLLAAYYTADIAADGPVGPATLYGSAHNYLSLGHWFPNGNSNYRVALRWD